MDPGHQHQRRRFVVKHLRTSLLILLALARPELACTAFLLVSEDILVFGRSFDWSVDDALVLVNKRGVARSSGSSGPSWVSKFGSVTFNQYGRNNPLGGINERGLVLATLWLDETEHRPPDSVPGIGSLRWVQYQLDNCSTVAQVMATDRQIRISPGPGSKVHYLVADARGGSAAVEFLGGRPVYHHGKELPRPVLTNSTCAESQSSLDRWQEFGGSDPLPDGHSSLARYARTCLHLDRFDPEDSFPARDYAFSMLKAVSSETRTMWSIVYDIPARKVWFRTKRNQELRWIELDRFNFSGATPCRMLDINARLREDVTTAFTRYTTKANRDLIYRVYRSVGFLRDTPDRILDEIARVPEADRYVGE